MGRAGHFNTSYTACGCPGQLQLTLPYCSSALWEHSVCCSHPRNAPPPPVPRSHSPPVPRPTVVPNGIATGLDIGFSNYSLVYITLSFYVMCKSTTPLFLLVFAIAWGIEKPSW